jgi:hypothetical protein
LRVSTGGPAFIAPLLAGNILPPLLEALSSSEAQAKLTIATLRTLNQIADAALRECPSLGDALGPSLSSIVREHIHTKSTAESLAELLAQSARSSAAQQQISLTAKLIANTCREESHRRLLLDVGILDLLASHLAAIASVDARELGIELRHAKRDELPPMYLPDILEAISFVIRNSQYNTARFLYSQSIQQVFAPTKATSSSTIDGYSTSHHTTPWDRLAPRLQTMQSKSDAYTKSWPALGAYTSATAADPYARLTSVDPSQPASRTVIMDESETPLFTWLMFVARRGVDKERLSACWLLALLKRFGDKWSLNDPSKTTRDRHFSYLIIPLVAKMIEEADQASEGVRRSNSLAPRVKEESMWVLERSPLVLAELVGGNKILQSAASDADIIATLVQILKKTFDSVSGSSKPPWSPNSSSAETREPMVDEPSSTLGRPGLTIDALHAFKSRESSLLALAAMADTQDGYRKNVIEAGAPAFIVDSFGPYKDTPNDLSSSIQGKGSTTAKDGNPAPVLIAACKLTRSLSRSISVLRTSLIDHGIAQPSFDLLTHPNVKVQIAATEVITNLVLEVSPMRSVSHCFISNLQRQLREFGILSVSSSALKSLDFADTHYLRELQERRRLYTKHHCVSKSRCWRLRYLARLCFLRCDRLTSYTGNHRGWCSQDPLRALSLCQFRSPLRQSLGIEAPLSRSFISIQDPVSG